MSKGHPSDVADKFMLRLPDGMRDRIREEAEANKRSMNQEIVVRLEESLARDTPEGVDADIKFVRKIVHETMTSVIDRIVNSDDMMQKFREQRAESERIAKEDS